MAPTVVAKTMVALLVVLLGGGGGVRGEEPAPPGSTLVDNIFDPSDGLPECTPEEIASCALENRVCLAEIRAGINTNATTLVDADDDAVVVTSCGPCAEGYVGIGGNLRFGNDNNNDDDDDDPPLCVDIGVLTLSGYLDEFEPVYRGDGPGGRPVAERLALLREAAAFVSNYTRNNPTAGFRLGLTAWSADAPDEYAQRSGFRDDGSSRDTEFASRVRPAGFATEASSLPSQLDWVELGAVTEVKNQGRCGCCWAVATVGTIEGTVAADPDNDGYLQNLSWQHLISCDKINGGCDGGSLVVSLGYSWLNRFGGMTRNNEYPYTDSRGDTTETCAIADKPLAVELGDASIVLDFGPPLDYETRVAIMKEALQQGPVAMVLKSSCRLLSNYRKGILTDDGDCACSNSDCLDHAVLMVGYDDDSQPPSWKIKNSWGTSWGEDGYFRVSQQPKDSWGLFGVMAHGVQAPVAANVTLQVVDEDLDEPLARWAILVIIAACLCVCLCLCRLPFQMMDAEPEGAAEQEQQPGGEKP